MVGGGWGWEVGLRGGLDKGIIPGVRPQTDLGLMQYLNPIIKHSGLNPVGTQLLRAQVGIGKYAIKMQGRTSGTLLECLQFHLYFRDPLYMPHVGLVLLFWNPISIVIIQYDVQEAIDLTSI